MTTGFAPQLHALSRLLESRFHEHRHRLLTGAKERLGEAPSGGLGDLQPGMRVLITLDRHGRVSRIGPPGKKITPREGEVLGIVRSVDLKRGRITLRAEDSGAEESFAVAQDAHITPPWTALQWKDRLDQLVQQAKDLQANIRVPAAKRSSTEFEPPPRLDPPTSKRDQKALQKAPGPDLSVGPEDDPHATPAAICPVGGFDKHSPILMDFARRSKENFALVAMFAPLSAMTPMHFYVVHFPIIAHVLQKYFPVGRVTAEEIGGIVAWLTDHLFAPDAKTPPKPAEDRRVADAGWKLTGTINGAKYAAIADVWNRRQEFYEHYLAAMEQIEKATGRATAAEPGEDEAPLDTDARGRLFDILNNLFQTYAGIQGTGLAKAGFMVQLLTGGLGCIDVHNRQIYDRLADHLIQTGKRQEGTRLKEYLQRLQRLTKQEYKDVVAIISNNGFGSRQVWNTWVDFAASLWDVIAERDPIYAKIDRVLQTTDFPYHLLGGLRVTKSVPPGNEPWNTLGAGGRPLKQGQTFQLPPVTGTTSGDALSSLHLTPVVSGGITDDPATWRRAQALMARNFDPRGSMSQLAQELPFRYVQATQAMPSVATVRRYYLARRRQREAEAQAREARKAYRAASLRGEAIVVDFRSWLRLQEANAEPAALTVAHRPFRTWRAAPMTPCSAIKSAGQAVRVQGTGQRTRPW